MVLIQNYMFRDINNGNMAYYRTKKRLILPDSVLRKFHRTKEILLKF